MMLNISIVKRNEKYVLKIAEDVTSKYLENNEFATYTDALQVLMQIDEEQNGKDKIILS